MRGHSDAYILSSRASKVTENDKLLIFTAKKLRLMEKENSTHFRTLRKHV